MNQPENPRGESGSFTTSETDAGTQIELFSEYAELERLRIASFDKRSDVAQSWIEAASESDRRQYEFRMEQIASSERIASRQLSIVRNVLYVGGGISLVAVLLLIVASVFGEPAQASQAIAILKYLAIGLGGAGVFQVLIRAVSLTLKGPPAG